MSLHGNDKRDIYILLVNVAGKSLSPGILRFFSESLILDEPSTTENDKPPVLKYFH